MLNDDLITHLISRVWFELENWSQLMWMNWWLILFHWLGWSWKIDLKLRSNQSTYMYWMLHGIPEWMLEERVLHI